MNIKKIIISFLVFFFLALPTVSLAVSIDNPLGDTKTPELLIGEVINTIFGIVGSLALLMFIYGGLTWMTSSGSSEAIKKGKNVIVWAAIGMAVIFLSYALVRFIIVGVGA
jgi:energy-converting hydrogenase Eha subunit E